MNNLLGNFQNAVKAGSVLAPVLADELQSWDVGPTTEQVRTLKDCGFWPLKVKALVFPEPKGFVPSSAKAVVLPDHDFVFNGRREAVAKARELLADGREWVVGSPAATFGGLAEEIETGDMLFHRSGRCAPVESKWAQKVLSRKRYHFFIPDDGEVIHWSDTLSDFQGTVAVKRDTEPGFAALVDSDPHVRVLDPETMRAEDFFLSSLLEADEIEF